MELNRDELSLRCPSLPVHSQSPALRHRPLTGYPCCQSAPISFVAGDGESFSWVRRKVKEKNADGLSEKGEGPVATVGVVYPVVRDWGAEMGI